MATIDDPQGRGPMQDVPEMIETYVRTRGGVVYTSRHDKSSLADRVQSAVNVFETAGAVFTLVQDADYVVIPASEIDHIRVRVVTS